MFKKLVQSGFTISAFTLFLLSATTTYAQSPCGDFVVVGVYEGEVYEERTEIEHCDNPFKRDDPPPFNSTLEINGREVLPSSLVTISPDVSSVGAFSILNTQSDFQNNASVPLQFYRKVGVDYYFEFESRRPLGLLAPYPQEFTLPVLPEGEYVAVFQFEEPPTLSRSIPWYEVIKNLFVPQTAFADQFSDHAQVVTLTFTIEYEDIVPEGASSVLFLPGIMGSRLYESADACGEDGEQERWLTFNECEQLRLLTSFLGVSNNAIYIKPANESVIDTVTVLPLYDGWLETLEDWKYDKKIIADYRAVPYDWRLRLEDILKTREINGKIIYDSSSTYQDSYIYQSLLTLAQTSKSNKVTIVAHSNGGLVAKALINAMEANNDPLLGDIDTLMLVAVPQTGTPDAITSILHGSELGYGIISDKKTSRALTNTAPFAHHLLPSEEYVEGSGASVTSSMINFLPGSVTDSWRDQYGNSIDSVAELHSFLNKNSGRVKPAYDDVVTPEVVEPFLLSYANTVQQELSLFTPPSSMEVLQLGGIGVGTTESITYFTDRECVDRSIFSFFQCIEYRDKLGYRINKVPEGDGTVVLPSALAMRESDNNQRVWVNLEEYNRRNINRVHRNILEIPELQDYVQEHLMQSPIRVHQYISTEPIVLTGSNRLVFQLHSPLDLMVTSEDGEVSSTTNSIKGSTYERVGELQYVSIPGDTKNPQVVLAGYAEGSFTLDVEGWMDEELGERVTFSGVPTKAGTKITLQLEEELASSTLLLDETGNGSVEATAFTNNQVFVNDEITTTPVILEPRQSSSGGGRVMSRLQGQVAGVSVKTNEAYLLELRTLLEKLHQILLLLKNYYE